MSEGLLPATKNCPTLNATILTAVHSTSLGSNVSLASGYPVEGYYCVNASGALQLVSPTSPVIVRRSAAPAQRRVIICRCRLLSNTLRCSPESALWAGSAFPRLLSRAGCGLVDVIAKDQKLTRCISGAAAVEFGLLLPGFAALLVGSLYASLMMYSAASMRYAVEGAARCYSVNATTCSDASKTQTYAQGLYYGTNSPTFTASTPACGHQVSATTNFALNMVVAKWTIPLSATSCFP
jgi:hypothetical protein